MTGMNSPSTTNTNNKTNISTTRLTMKEGNGRNIKPTIPTDIPTLHGPPLGSDNKSGKASRIARINFPSTTNKN